MANREEKNQFSMMIMQAAINQKTDHINAIASYCEKNNFEIEMAAGLINECLKSIIEGEAMEMRYLPRGSRLPL